MNKPLNVLMVDDSSLDASLLERTLQRGGFEVTSKVVVSAKELRFELEKPNWDIVTSDHSMPQFNAIEALNIMKELRPELPFIIVSGDMDIDLVVALMQGGAKDYVNKLEITRIIPVIERELISCNLAREKKRCELESKRTETYFRTLFDSALDGLLIVDARTGIVRDVNPSLVNLTGYSKEEILEREISELEFFVDVETPKKIIETLINEKSIRFDMVSLKTKLGNHVAVEIYGNEFLVDNLRVAKINIRDITDHEISLIKLNKINSDLDMYFNERISELESLNKELESFDLSIAHDLRAPLRHILGFSNVLIEDYSKIQNSESLHIINQIRGSVERMNLLIDALLGLARFSKINLSEIKVNLSTIVENITTGLINNSPDRLIEFIIAKEVIANCDESLLRIVLENLLSNAWKFSVHCEKAIIEFGVILRNNTKTYFVRDNGVGFDMKYSEKLFTPFTRLHSEAEFPGVGIGLSTVQRIIHRHGGKVWAESEVDNGTTIYFTLANEKQEMVTLSE